jgi:putative redox protein
MFKNQENESSRISYFCKPIKNLRMRTTTRIVEDYVYETINENGNKISIDMREDHEKDSHGPMELVLGAVSGCVAVDIVAILRKRKKQIDNFVIETSGKRNEEHPKSFTHIHSKYVLTSPNVKKEELEKIAGLALDKYCSVASSLRAEINYSVEVINP